MTRFFLFALIAMSLLPLPAYAQNAARAIESLNTINAARPLQNPQYERGEQVLKRRILDRKNKVVGEVRDLLIARSGAVEAITIEFDRLQLMAPVTLNRRSTEIRPSSNGYMLSLEASQIAPLIPGLLADVETAAGNADNPQISLRRMDRIDVMIEGGGGKIGHIRDVLFNADGDRIEALYVAMTAGTMRGESIAIPFEAAAIRENNGPLAAFVSADFAKAMTDFAARKR